MLNLMLLNAISLFLQVCDLPVRATRFVPRKNWIVTGSDDMNIRVFNYNTLERLHMFEAHSDYVRCIIIHPTQPFLLSSSGEKSDQDAVISQHFITIFFYCRRHEHQAVELGEELAVRAGL